MINSKLRARIEFAAVHTNASRNGMLISGEEKQVHSSRRLPRQKKPAPEEARAHRALAHRVDTNKHFLATRTLFALLESLLRKCADSVDGDGDSGHQREVDADAKRRVQQERQRSVKTTTHSTGFTHCRGGNPQIGSLSKTPVWTLSRKRNRKMTKATIEFLSTVRTDEHVTYEHTPEFNKAGTHRTVYPG